MIHSRLQQPPRRHCSANRSRKFFSRQFSRSPISAGGKCKGRRAQGSEAMTAKAPEAYFYLSLLASEITYIRERNPTLPFSGGARTASKLEVKDYLGRRYRAVSCKRLLGDWSLKIRNVSSSGAN